MAAHEIHEKLQMHFPLATEESHRSPLALKRERLLEEVNNVIYDIEATGVNFHLLTDQLTGGLNHEFDPVNAKTILDSILYLNNKTIYVKKQLKEKAESELERLTQKEEAIDEEDSEAKEKREKRRKELENMPDKGVEEFIRKNYAGIQAALRNKNPRIAEVGVSAFLKLISDRPADARIRTDLLYDETLEGLGEFLGNRSSDPEYVLELAQALLSDSTLIEGRDEFKDQETQAEVKEKIVKAASRALKNADTRTKLLGDFMRYRDEPVVEQALIDLGKSLEEELTNFQEAAGILPSKDEIE